MSGQTVFDEREGSFSKRQTAWSAALPPGAVQALLAGPPGGQSGVGALYGELRPLNRSEVSDYAKREPVREREVYRRLVPANGAGVAKARADGAMHGAR